MSSIDDRIVRLEVQDSDFAKRLEKDEEALKKIDKAFRDASESNVASNIDKIASKFSNLGIVGVRALENITDKAISAGTTLVKSLTVDNIAAGWEKLAQQTKAVGTLSIQGFDQKDVDDAIAQLMWYSDETSYNFNDMLTAMTKFTAQSYSLKDSLDVLEGIANWAAVAGQNAQAGSSAMEILSKAVGRGYVGQEQWSSLQTIMMDNKQIRQMIIDNAVRLGTLKKVSDNTYKSLSDNIVSSVGASEFTLDQFATYLTTGKWLTSDVLVATMKQYSEAVRPVYEYVQANNVSAADAIEALNGKLSDQALKFFAAAQEARSLEDALESVRVGSASTWQTTFNTIFGDYEQQKELWTDLSGYLYDLFVESGNKRNALLEEWSESGGRDAFIQSIYNILDAITKLRNVVVGVWEKIFPPKTGQDLLTLTQRFEQFTSKLANSNETFIKIGRVLQGVFSLLRLGKMVISALLEPIKAIFGIVDTGSILDIVVAVADAVTNFVHWLEVNDKVHLSLQGIANVAKVLFGIVAGAFKLIFDTGSKIFKAFKDVVSGGKGLIESFTDVFKSPKENASKLEKQLGDLSKTGTGAFKDTTEEANKFKKQLDELISSGDEVVDVPLAYADKIDKELIQNTGESLTFLDRLKLAFSDLGTLIKGVYTDVIKPVFTKIGDFLGVSTWFKNGLIPGLTRLFSTILGFKAILGIGKIISSVFGAVANVISGIAGAIGIIGSINQTIRAGALLKAAAGVGILVTSIYALTQIDSTKLKSALKTLKELVKGVAEAVQSFTIRSAVALKILTGIDLVPIITAFGVFAAAIWGVNVAMNAFAKMEEALGKKPEDRTKFEQSLVDLHDSFGNILDLFKGDNVHKVINYISEFVGIFSVAAIPLGIFKIASAIKVLAKNFKGLFSINNTFKLIQTDTSIPAKILKVASAIALIVGALFVLTNLVDKDRLWAGVGAIGVISAILGALTGALTWLSKSLAKSEVITDKKKTKKIANAFYDIGKNTWSIAKSIALVAGAAAALAFVAKKMPGALGWALGCITAIGAIMVAVEGLGALFTRKNTKVASNVKAIGKAFIEIAFAGGILALSISYLSKLEWNDLVKGLVGVGVSILSMTVALGGVLTTIQGYSIAGIVLAVGAAFIEIAGAMLLLDLAINNLSILGANDTLLEGVVGVLIGLVGMAGALALVLKVIDGYNIGWTIIAVGIAFVAVAGATSFLADSITKVATAIDNGWTALGMAGSLAAGLLAMAVAISVVFKAVNSITGVGMLKTLGVSLAALYLLVGVINLLADAIAKTKDINPWNVLIMAGAMVILTAELGVLAAGLEVLGGAGDVAVPALLGIAAVIGTIALVLAAAAALVWALTDALIKLDEFCANPKSNFGANIAKFLEAIARPIGWIAEGLTSIWNVLEKIAGFFKKKKDTFWGKVTGSIVRTITPIGGILSLSDLADLEDKAEKAGEQTGEAYVKAFDTGVEKGAANIDPNVPTHLSGVVIKKAKQTGDEVVEIAHSYNEKVSSEAAETVSNVENTAAEGGEKSAMHWWDKFTSFFKGESDSFLPDIKTTLEDTTKQITDKISESMSQFMPEGISDMFNDLKTDEYSNYAAGSFGEWLGLITGEAYSETVGWQLKKVAKKAVEIDKAFAAVGASADSTLASVSRRLSTSLKPGSGLFGSATRAILLADGSTAKLHNDIDAIFEYVGDNQITPVIDTSAWDNSMNKMLGDISSLKSGLGDTAKDQEKELEDWELSTEELVRKYAVLSTSVDSNGNIIRSWTYNGPMGIEIVPGEVEWAYDGPISGFYDIAEDRYLFKELNGSIKDISQWDAWAQKEQDDWKLSTEELIRKYSTLSTEIDAAGNVVRSWKYNGPMGGEIVPGEVEWVYEGPRSGLYDISEDKYLFEVSGHVKDISEWNAQMRDVYFGLAEYQEESLDSINSNIDSLNSNILDQTEWNKLYNQYLQDQLSGINSSIGTLSTDITGLGDSFSNLGVYLDSGALVGQLTNRIDSALGNKQALVSRGVIR